MTTPQTRSSKAAPTTIVTTNTGRILRVSAAEAEATMAAKAQAVPTAQPVVDPARRADVLFRVRRAEGHEVSSWWMIGAFLATSGLVILLLSGVPGVA
jgi:hypothetical protein